MLRLDPDAPQGQPGCLFAHDKHLGATRCRELCRLAGCAGGTPSLGGPAAFADVEDLDPIRETLLAAGATERDAPRQFALETRISVLTDRERRPDRAARRTDVTAASGYRARLRPGSRHLNI